MRRLIRSYVERLPLHFRVLYRQFLLRVIDLESLSIEADIPRFLGQFAGILIMISTVQAIGALWLPPPPSMAWHIEQSLFSNLVLLVGLCSVLTWDSIFPDRRDALLLGPLPVSPRTILFAKMSASATLLLVGVLCLNVESSVAWALVLGVPAGGVPEILRFLLAEWFTLLLATAFGYGSVLAMQGFSSLLLPRRIFLRVSAVLQLFAYAAFLIAYFLPYLNNYAEATNPAHRALLAYSPALWWFALFNQINGTLPVDLSWVAQRGWIAVAVTLAAAGASLLFSYRHTMRKTVEEPDLLPGRSGYRWMSWPGSALKTAIVQFCFRSILRSRQHRVALALFWSVVFAIALAWIRHAIATPPTPVESGFLISTFVMLAFAVLGLRTLFALPISLKANWILRVTQLRSASVYQDATRAALLILGVAPIWLLSAALALHTRPWNAVAEHLVFLAFIGWLLVELALIRFDKVPFTCSYLPGKTNVAVFWGFAYVFLTLGILLALFEEGALRNARKYLLLLVLTAAISFVLRVFNRIRVRNVELYFEEQFPDEITRLGLVEFSNVKAAHPPAPSQAQPGK